MKVLKTVWKTLIYACEFFHDGYRVIYTPDSLVKHHESVAPDRFKHNDYNADLYMSLWKDEASDEHRYYREDKEGFLRILLKDLRNMSWGPNKYGTRPLWIGFARFIYLPARKIIVLLRLLSKGDFLALKRKISKLFHHES